MANENTCEFKLKGMADNELQETTKTLINRTMKSVMSNSRVRCPGPRNTFFNLSISVFTVLFFLNILCVSETFGAQEISGAFGMKLGETFDTSTAIGTGSLSDGTPMYQFSPKKRFKAFDRYFVIITPKSHKIYSIWGMGKCKDTVVCEKDLAHILRLLQNKYGVAEKDVFVDTLTTIKQIDQGNRFILVKCSGFPDVKIEIRYYDRRLNKLVEMELLELKSSLVDDSAL